MKIATRYVESRFQRFCERRLKLAAASWIYGVPLALRMNAECGKEERAERRCDSATGAAFIGSLGQRPRVRGIKKLRALKARLNLENA